jgi:hypothetical protein
MPANSNATNNDVLNVPQNDKKKAYNQSFFLERTVTIIADAIASTIPTTPTVVVDIDKKRKMKMRESHSLSLTMEPQAPNGTFHL